METNSLTVVYHPSCKASTDFIIKVDEVENYNKEFINLKEDTIESSQINVDIVPLLIINDDPNRVYKGKEAFDILNTLKSEIKQQNKKTNSMKYGTAVHFIEQQDNKKERIELEKR
jgi:hypothetical protein